MSDTLLILHVKGTEQDTKTLPKQVVRAAISQGQITHSQLIWSVPDNAWKQVRELPHLLPSQKLAPMPPAPVASEEAPKAVQATGPVPRIAGKAATPKVKVTAQPVMAKAATAKPAALAGKKPTLVQSTGELEVEDHDGFHPLKWLCIVLGLIILVALGVNYFLVDQPLASRLSQTTYSETTVYAHLGAFMQPNVLIIHIPPSSTLTDKNLTSFLVALAKSTPAAPLSGNLFERVALTPGYTGRYSFSGYAWKQLGEMGLDDEAQRKDFLLDQMGDAAGEPLISGNSNLSDDAQQALREKVWQSFADQFVPPQN